MDRWSQIDCTDAQREARWRLKRIGETSKKLAGQFGDKTEQTPYARHAHKCPTVREEPSELGPTNPAQREELGILDVIAPEEEPRPIGLPPTTQPHPALTHKPMCTCGTAEPCKAHD